MASLSKNNLTQEEIAKQLGKDIESKRKALSNTEVIKRVAKEFEIKSSDIKGKRRTKDIALARQICMYIFREELDYKLEEIAGFVNRKDHTTIMHGIDKIKSMRMADESFREQLIQIIESLHQ
jgi:chromosomal replication initiator protein